MARQRRGKQHSQSLERGQPSTPPNTHSHTHRLADVFELDVDLLRPADALQHLAPLLPLAAQDQRVWRVGQDERADGEEERGDGTHREGHAPAVGAEVLGAVVDELAGG